MNKHDSEQRFDSAIVGLCNNVKKLLQSLPNEIKQDAQEIRLRSGRPLTIYGASHTYFISKEGRPEAVSSCQLYRTTIRELEESFHTMCSYSVYSFQNEIRNGFITIQGGHRVGICGTAVYHHGEISGIRDISTLSIRISRQINGAANALLSQLEGDAAGLLLAGAPCSGKTTILRDLARQLSTGSLSKIYKVVVVDERGELGGTCGGICHNDLGLCDVLNGYPKGEGIQQAVRCLSPDVVICDEVGNLEDIAAIEEGLNAGVGIIASIHADSPQELVRRVQAQRLLQTGAFQKVAFLQTRSAPGSLAGIYKVGDLDVKNIGMPSNHSGRSGSGVSAIA